MLDNPKKLWSAIKAHPLINEACVCISSRLYFYIHDCDEPIFCGEPGDFKESELFIFYFPGGYAKMWVGAVFEAKEWTQTRYNRKCKPTYLMTIIIK